MFSILVYVWKTDGTSKSELNLTYLSRIAMKAADAHSTEVSIVTVMLNLYRALVGLVD